MNVCMHGNVRCSLQDLVCTLLPYHTTARDYFLSQSHIQLSNLCNSQEFTLILLAVSEWCLGTCTSDLEVQIRKV
jgi:hypothetical protein